MADSFLIDLSDLSFGDSSAQTGAEATQPQVDAAVPAAAAPAQPEPQPQPQTALNLDFFNTITPTPAPASAAGQPSSAIMRILDQDSDDDEAGMPWGAPVPQPQPTPDPAPTPVAAAPAATGAPYFSQLHSAVSPANPASAPIAPMGATMNDDGVLDFGPAVTQNPTPAPAPAQVRQQPAQPATAPAATTASATTQAKPASSAPTTPGNVNGPTKHEGDMERKVSGWLSEYWEPVYMTLKNCRLSVYTIKDGRRDIHPSQTVYLNEAEVAISQDSLTVQIVHERKGINWVLRCPLGIAYMRQWLQVFTQHLKWYKSLNQVTEPTIMELLLVLGCTRKSQRTKENYRSFQYYMSKASTGYFAMAAALVMELYIRKCIDISEQGVLSVKDRSTLGVALLDETLIILKHKLKKENPQMRLVDFIKQIGTQAGTDIYTLQMPALRAVDMAIDHNILGRLGKKEYVVTNQKLEERLIRIVRCEEGVSKDDVRVHDVMAIAFTMMKIASKDCSYLQTLRHNFLKLSLCFRVVYYNQDVVDRNKIFPGIIAAEQLIPRVEALGKHLGGFHKNKVQILSALHTAATQWLSGGKVPPGGAKKTIKY
jgi:hypothetical protein